MNVLYLTINPHTGSTARVLIDWVRVAGDFGVNAHIVVPEQGALLDEMLSMHIPSLASCMPWPDKKRPWQFLSAIFRIWKWASRHKIELIHCQEHNVYPFARILAKWLGVPCVSHVQYLLDPGFSHWAYGKGRFPDALIWTAESQRTDSAQAVESVVPQDVQQVIPMGLDIDHYVKSQTERDSLRQKWGFNHDDIVIGTASAIRDRKRIHEFLDIVEDLTTEHSNVIGAFAGGHVPDEIEYFDKIEKRLVQLEEKGIVRWVGHLEPVEPFYHAIDIFVSTSQYETFGMSVCEAMACGKPVAGYRGGSIGEVLGETGFVVETGDLDGLTQAIDQLIRQPDLRSQMGQRAKERVATEFNPRKSFEQLVQIYEQLLSSRAKRK